MNAIINIAGQQTMSSREIADLCGARHNDVVATIRRLFERGILRESRNIPRPLPPQGRGRPIDMASPGRWRGWGVFSKYN